MNDDRHQQQQDDDDEYCPICFGEFNSVAPPTKVVGDCGHPCCLPCISRVFAQRHHQYHNMNTTSSSSHPLECVLNLPTKGRCPVCRSMLDVFELRYKDINVASKGQGKEQEGQLQQHEYTEPRYVYPQQPNEFCDLAGKVYVRWRKNEGDMSIHFPSISVSDENGGDIEQSTSHYHPYLSLEKSHIQSDDEVNRRVPFENYRYHIDSRTFHGSIVWREREGCFIGGCWDFLMSFSSDFRYVSHGFIIKNNKKETSGLLTNDTTIRNGQPSSLQVVQFGTDRGDDNDTGSSWRGQSSSSFYHLLGVETGTDSILLPTYNPLSVWGNVFCQVLTVGMASYHFLDDGTERAYISYEHERTSVWPHLDNGRPIPSRIFFTETRYDSEQKIFRGKIDWEGTHQSTWNGSRFWRYEIRFANDFSCIIGGNVLATQIGRDESEMSRFGSDLIYLNCGMLEDMKDNGSDVIDMRGYGRGVSPALITDQLRSIRQQMEEISSPPESIERLQALFVLAQSRDISYPAIRSSSSHEL